MVFGKTVPDISLNAVANLGYADCRFLTTGGGRRHADERERGDRAQGELNRQTGVVHVRSTGMTSDGQPVLSFIRWVMVRKRDQAAVIDAAHVPVLAQVEPAALAKPARKSISPDGTMRWPAARCASRTTRPASGSIMSTG